jgi:hypothetical protein
MGFALLCDDNTLGIGIYTHTHTQTHTHTHTHTNTHTQTHTHTGSFGAMDPVEQTRRIADGQSVVLQIDVDGQMLSLFTLEAVSVCGCFYTHTHTHTHTHTQLTHTLAHTERESARARERERERERACTHTCTHTEVPQTRIHIHTHTHMHTRTGATNADTMRNNTRDAIRNTLVNTLGTRTQEPQMLASCAITLEKPYIPAVMIMDTNSALRLVSKRKDAKGMKSSQVCVCVCVCMCLCV